MHAETQAELAIWQAVDDAIGSASGDRFRRFVQGITLDHMVQLANDHLHALTPRYRLARGNASDLTLHHAVVVQIEGSSYRLRQHAELMPEHVRSKALIAPPAFAPPQKPRGRPPKNPQFAMPSTSA